MSPLRKIAVPLAIAGLATAAVGFFWSFRWSDAHRYDWGSVLPAPLVIFFGGLYIYGAAVVCAEPACHADRRDAAGRAVHLLFLATNFLALWTVGNAAIALPPGHSSFEDLSPLYVPVILFAGTFVIGVAAWATSGFPPTLKFSFELKQ